MQDFDKNLIKFILFVDALTATIIYLLIVLFILKFFKTMDYYLVK